MKRAIASDNIINSTDKSVLEHQRDRLKCHHQLHQTGYDSNFPAFSSNPIVGSMGPDLRWVNGWSGFGFGSGMGLETNYGSVVTEAKETPSISSETSRSGCFKKRKLGNVKGVGALMQADDKESKNKKMTRRFEEDEEEEEEKSKITEENVGSSKRITKKKKVTKDQQNSSNDSSKGDYIHVRARRGQATDSHSLAERVRREKISERMKFLQDLVPGCNKITGKAGMLDEIINYVQSLQIQIEFLSMKLAAVNPRLDFEAVDDIFRKEVVPAQATNFTNVVMPSHDMVNSGYLEFSPVQQVAQCSGTQATVSDQMWDSEIQNLYSSLGFDQELSPLTTFTNSQPF